MSDATRTPNDKIYVQTGVADQRATDSAGQAARRIAHRVHGRHRHVSGHAGLAAARAIAVRYYWSAAALNCLVEQRLDAVMARTRARPLPTGDVTPMQALVFIAIVGGTGLLVLHSLTNPLTMWLTLATFLGYAVVYTLVLKPRTSQNIVIGGASGAMPPVLGWAAVTGEISSDALLLFLIIFAWTPPHFWALALYRKHEYARAGVPMLPVTHGDRFTRLHVLLYAMLLAAICLLPFASGMSGTIYLISTLALNGVFVAYAVRLYVNYSDGLARRTFRYSIVYLSCLFAALLVDHYWRFP